MAERIDEIPAATLQPDPAARAFAGLTVGLRGPGRLVAILGPDGAGKTTLADALIQDLPGQTHYVYMGLWRESRWDPVLRRVPGGRTGQLLVRAAAAGTRVRYHRFRGRLVVVDRFAYDVLTASASTLTAQLISRFALAVAPEPDCLLLLDAPGTVMFARKGEHTVEILERNRQGYLGLTERFPGMVVIDATQTAEEVRQQAVHAVRDGASSRGSAQGRAA